MRVAKSMGPAAILLALASCGSDVSVPDSVDIAGCYSTPAGYAIQLRDAKVIASGRAIATFTRGKSKAGSYLTFEPLLRLRQNGSDEALVVSAELPRGDEMTIMEGGVPVILMPTDPLGQVKLKKTDCASPGSK